MAEYTPTMANVRTSFAEAWAAEVMSDDADWIQDYEQGLAAFDRALAAHDRVVKAEALREAAEDWGDTTWNDVWMADGVEDDVSAVQSTVKWLRARADALDGDRG